MIYKSTRPDAEVPEVTLHEYVLADAAERGDAPAIVVGDDVTSYAQLAADIARVAAGLQGKGIAKGDVVALIGGNSAAWAVAYHAILTAGGVVTPINPLLTPDEVAKQLTDSKAKLLIATEPLVEPLTPAAEQSGVEEVISLEDAAALGDEGATPEPVDISPDDVAALPYSSGTTGAMKGVMLTHRALVANLEQNQGMAALGPDDALVALLPFFHIYGQTVVLNHGLSKGAKIVVMPRFDFDEMLDIVETPRNHPASRRAAGRAGARERAAGDRPRLLEAGDGHLGRGAARPGPGRARRGADRGAGPPGLRDDRAQPRHQLDARWRRPTRIPAGSVGPLLPNTEARLVDPESGEDVAEGEQGELWIRGPQMMRGYLEKPEATAETITEDGWLRTGDIARIDADGNAYIVDRLKELIKYKGYQVPPAELEAILISHPRSRMLA